MGGVLGGGIKGGVSVFEQMQQRLARGEGAVVSAAQPSSQESDALPPAENATPQTPIVEPNRTAFERYDDELGKRPDMTSEERLALIEDLTKNHKFLGDIKPPAFTPKLNEDIPITEQHSLQSRRQGMFEGVTEGKHRDPESCYLWTIDERGINIARERTPFPTGRGWLVHSNLSKKAYAGGEVWFDGKRLSSTQTQAGLKPELKYPKKHGRQSSDFGSIWVMKWKQKI